MCNEISRWRHLPTASWPRRRDQEDCVRVRGQQVGESEGSTQKGTAQFGRLRSAEKLANQVRLAEPRVRLWVPNLVRCRTRFASFDCLQGCESRLERYV